jgi:hypothetical protein
LYEITYTVWLRDKGIPSFFQVTIGSGSPSAGHGITISLPDRTLNSTGPAGGKLGGSTRKNKIGAFLLTNNKHDNIFSHSGMLTHCTVFKCEALLHFNGEAWQFKV